MKEVLTVIRNPLGGIRTYIKYIYGALPKGKYHFTIVIFKGGEKDSAFIRNDLEKRGVSFTLHEVTGKSPNKALIQYVYRLLKKQKIDLIHSHGLTSGVLTVCANVFKGIPHIITSHDVFRVDQFEGFKGGMKKYIVGKLLSKATVLQSVSEDAQANLIEYLRVFENKTDKLTVIQNGIEIESFAGKRDLPKGNIRKELHLNEDDFLFGFLGRFMPQKGFEYLIDAVEILSKNPKWGSNFKILAVNESDYIREYKKIIRERNLNEFFIFYGFVSDIAPIFNDLDAMVMPSLWEAYGLLAAEAFIMGCPVIAANCIGLREVIKDTPALIVLPQDSESLAEEINYLMENKDKIIKKAREFIPVAEERYNIKNAAENLNKLFEKVINKEEIYA